MPGDSNTCANIYNIDNYCKCKTDSGDDCNGNGNGNERY